jgi:predicted ATP-dependent endonuclease of OLD family
MLDSSPNETNEVFLDIRIYSRRHLVSLPFQQRSKGFIWFFSFLVWFEDAQQQSGAQTPLVLLLDEPGFSLYTLGQADLLKYFERLGEANQLVYTTHSPFLVESDRLDRVRLVEDRKGEGTVVLNDLAAGDSNSTFPLQAALGYTIAQNLFIAEKNLLIEGPADLIFLLAASEQKVATFIALLRGNQLRFAVCVDRAGVPASDLTTWLQRSS